MRGSSVLTSDQTVCYDMFRTSGGLPVKNARRLQVLCEIFNTPSEYWVNEWGENYRLVGKIVREIVQQKPGVYVPGDIKFDMRLHYFNRKMKLIATDHGIRFTERDLRSFVNVEEMSGKTIFETLLEMFYNPSLRRYYPIDDGHIIVARKKTWLDNKGNLQVYVDFRKHYQHRETHRLHHTCRGFKFSRRDLDDMLAIERKCGMSIFRLALTTLERYKTSGDA